MKHFKFLIALLALVALAFTATAQNRYVGDGALQTQTFTVAATAGTNVGYVISCSDQASVPIQITLMADASGAYEFRIPLQYSVDGSTYAGMGSSSVNISFNGVTAQTIVTNIPTHGVGYIKIPFLTNVTASIAVTNGTIKGAVNWNAPAAIN